MTGADPAQHHDPDQEDGDLLDGGGQPATVEVHVPRASARWRGQQDPRQASSLDGIPPAPRGVPQIEVTFDIDANGIVHVTAKDKATNTERAIKIEASSGLSEADIKRAVEEAAAHEAEDKLRKEAIEARNQLDSLLYGTKKLVKENEAKLSDADKLMAEEEFKKSESVLESNREPSNPDELRSAFESLQAVAHKIAETMYKAAGGPSGDGQADAGASPGPGGDDVIDADYTDKQ
jgi:molecular chaperone DnaK